MLRNASIGRYCSIGDNVCVGVGKHALSWASTTSMTSTSFMFDDICSFGNFDGRIAPCEPMDWWPAHTKIGHDVWFGTGVFVPGAHEISIGTGAVVAGNPAKVVKMRFSDEIIADLESSKWWEYDWPLATARLGIKAPFSDAKDFCAWWADGGAELLAPFRLDAKLARIRQDENGAFLDRLNYNFDNIF